MAVYNPNANLFAGMKAGVNPASLGIPAPVAQPIAPQPTPPSQNFGANAALNQKLAASTGYTGNFGSGGFQQFLAAQDAKAKATQPPGTAAPAAGNLPAQFQNGTVPITVEPMNDWQKEALSALQNPGSLGGGGMIDAQNMLKEMLANPQAFAAKYTNPQATTALNSGQAALAAGTAPITMQDIQGVENPYADALKARLTQAGERARAAINATEGQRGGRSFGDTATGVRNANLDSELLMGEGDINHQSFADAVAMLQDMRNRSVQGGQAFGNLATQAQGINTNAAQTGMAGTGALFDSGQIRTNQGFQNINNRLAAGDRVFNYNQGVNNLIGEDMLKDTPEAKIGQIMEWLKSLQSNNSGATPAANSMTTAGGIMNTLAGLFNGGGGSFAPAGPVTTSNTGSLPWLSAGQQQLFG